MTQDCDHCQEKTKEENLFTCVCAHYNVEDIVHRKVANFCVDDTFYCKNCLKNSFCPSCFTELTESERALVLAHADID